MEVNLGAIRFNWKGAYAGGTAYVVDDVVSSGGSSYICILASTGNAVSNTTYWSQMSAAGTDGTDGTDIGTTITTQGDILYRDGSGLQRLAKGTAAQVLTVNSGATAPEWAAPAAGGAWTYIIANSANTTYRDFTLSSSYDLFAFSFQGVVGTVDGQGMRMRTSSNAGSSYDSGGSDYNWRYDYHDTTGTNFISYNTTNGDSIIMTYGIGTGSVYHFSGILYVHSAPSTSKHALMHWSLPGIHSTSNRIHENKGFGSRNTASAIDGIRFYMNSGNFSGGIIRLYGISNS